MSENENNKNQTQDKSTRRVCYIRLTEEEHIQIQSMVQSLGLTAPQIFRKALFEPLKFVRPFFAQSDAKEIMIELNRQGNNLNQIAKRINSGLAAGWNQSFNGLLKAYVDLRHLIASNHGSC